MIVHVLKTWYVSVNTEFLKQFSKPEKPSYEVLNGQRRYVSLWEPTSSKKGNIFPYVYVSFVNTHFIENRQHFPYVGLCVSLCKATSSKIGNIYPYTYLFVNDHFIENRQHLSLYICLFVNDHFTENRKPFFPYV